jgi:hypothetical protein
MAITKTIEIDVNSQAAEKDVNKLVEQFEDLGKASTKSIKNIEKGVENTEKSTKTLSDGFKGVGLAIKAMGIGLIIGALSTLKEVFMGNQKVADTFSAVMGTVSNIFSQVTNIIVSMVEKVGSASNGFEGLSKTIGGLLTLSLTPLKAAFYAIKLTIDEVRLAWEESIFGDGDSETIKKLTKRIEETKGSLKEVGTDAIEAGIQVANNIGKAITEVGAVVEGTIDGVSKISIAGAYEQAKANVQLQNSAKLAEAEQARLVEQYDRQAEKLRQIRDNEFNTIAERQKANDDLLKVLEKQEAAMLAQANAQVAAAQATYQQNKSIENRAAVTNALANAEGVLAQIEGLRSEQDSNKNALIKESIDLLKSKSETETQLAINQKLFDAERLKDEVAKLEAQKMAMENERTLELERLQNNINIYKEGTQARIDAENEYALRKQEIDNNIIAKEDEIAQYRLDKQLEKKQIDIDNEALSFEERLNTLNERERLITEATNLSEAERTRLLKENSDARVSIQEKETAAKLALMNAVANGLAVASQELGENTAAGKAFAVAAASISTYTAIAGQLAAFSGVPIPGYAIAQAIVTGAVGLLNVKKILAVKTPKGGGGGSTPSNISGGGGGAAAPSFNVVGNSGVNQIAQTLGNQQPMQAYVVANNVTTQQSLDRNIVNNASLG